ncbi:MAG: ankyrin repeat domain-containing protein [Tatlockia sp.]|nr:ankyrin repeat domain-containing protein [Tatlockia sp.]
MFGRSEYSIEEHLNKSTNIKLNDYIFDWVIDNNITLECLENEITAEEIFLDAIEVGYLDALLFFIENKYVKPTSGGSPLTRAFCHAVTKGQFELVQWFLKNSDLNPTTLENVPIKRAFENGHVDVVLLLASQPSVIAALAKKKQDGEFKELCQEVEELMKTVKATLNNYSGYTCFFFECSTDNNNLLSYFLKKLKFCMANLSLDLTGKELNLSDKQLKNIVSIKDTILAVKDESATAVERARKNLVGVSI